MSLHVSVYTMLAHDGGGARLAAPQEPALAEWALEVGYKSNQSSPFPPVAKFICILAESDCAIAFGEDPVAKNGLKEVKAGERLYFGVHPGHKLAVIAS